MNERNIGFWIFNIAGMTFVMYETSFLTGLGVTLIAGSFDIYRNGFEK